MNNNNQRLDPMVERALEKIKYDQQFKPDCGVIVGPTGPTGPTGPGGGSGGETGPTHTVKSVIKK